MNSSWTIFLFFIIVPNIKSLFHHSSKNDKSPLYPQKIIACHCVTKLASPTSSAAIAHPILLACNAVIRNALAPSIVSDKQTPELGNPLDVGDFYLTEIKSPSSIMWLWVQHFPFSFVTRPVSALPCRSIQTSHQIQLRIIAIKKNQFLLLFVCVITRTMNQSRKFS